MYKKCENCYKDGKTPNEESCKKCEDDLKAKEQDCVKLKLDLIEAKAHGDYLNNLALSKTLDTVSEQLDQLKSENEDLKKQLMQKSEVDMFFNTPIENWSNNPCEICPHKAENEQLKEEEKTVSELSKAVYALAGLCEKYYQALQEIGEVAKSISSFKSISEEPFAEVMKHCPYLNDNVFCTENKTSCVGCICARKQTVYYGEKVAYLEQILQKISECNVELKNKVLK